MPLDLSEMLTKDLIYILDLILTDFIFTGSILGLIFEILRPFENLLLAAEEGNEQHSYPLAQKVLV